MLKTPLPLGSNRCITDVAHMVAQANPNRQDRFAFMAPLAAVVLFMAAITTAFWYLRYEELDREQEVVAAMWNTHSSVCVCDCWTSKSKSCAWRVTLQTAKQTAKLSILEAQTVVESKP